MCGPFVDARWCCCLGIFAEETLRHREVMCPVQGHGAHKWRVLDGHPGSLDVGASVAPALMERGGVLLEPGAGSPNGFRLYYYFLKE